MASIERTAYPRFSQQLSDRELDARFGPTTEEADLVRREGQSDKARLTFLVMLKSLQQLGYSPLLNEVPEQVVAFSRTALNLPESTDLIDGRTRSHRLSRQRNLIRAQLGIRRYADGGETVITPVIRSAALNMSNPADLISLAIETLTKVNVELPAFSALDRVVGHLLQEVHARLYQPITADLTYKLAAALDALLEVPPGRTSPPSRDSKNPRDRRHCTISGSGPIAWPIA